MEITNNQRPADPVQRRRQQAEAVAKPTDGGQPKVADTVQLASKDPATITRYVGVLKGMDPANLHKVEDLKARIAAGTYTADPEELADMILGLTDGRDDDRRGA